MASLARAANVALQRVAWTRRADRWDHAEVTGLDKVVDAVLALLPAERLGCVVDLGAGTGRLSLPLAERAERVIAVDLSAPMLERLRARASEQGLTNVETRLSSLESLDVPPGSVDAIVSCYALHHLRDPDKEALARKALTWLRPGAPLVIGDMMLGRGGTARDRQILASKVQALVRRGPGGWWRIAKGVLRLGLRVQERPLSPDAWARLLRECGFSGATSAPVVAEAAVAWGTRPA